MPFSFSGFAAVFSGNKKEDTFKRLNRTSFQDDFSGVSDRIWIGENYWAIPMEDWRVNKGRIEFSGQKLNASEGPDSQDMIQAILGKSKKERDHLVEHARTFALIKGSWKYIEPNNGPKVNQNVHIELGNTPEPQLYNLDKDFGEINNVADHHPEVISEM